MTPQPESLKSFIIYRSSAGSGKTYTLAREYILLALQFPSYPHPARVSLVGFSFRRLAATINRQ